MLGVLLIPTALSANHGVEALGVVVAFFALLIGLGICLIPTLVFLFRKKPPLWASYVLLILNFGTGIFFFALAGDLDEGILLGGAGILLILGTLVLMKTIKTQ